MKDKARLDLDKYELGIIINALNEFKNNKLKNNDIEQNTIGFSYSDNSDIVQPINELLLKAIDAQEKIKTPKRTLEVR
ncbi:MAG: hypothetical protein Q4E39_00815 [bacterium]|nr:hypothetical protein [bacterium]